MSRPLVFRSSSSIVLAAPSALGFLAVAVSRETLVGVSMAHKAASAGVQRLARMLGETLEPEDRSCLNDGSGRMARDIADRLVRYLDGEPMNFTDVPVALDHLSPFQRRVVAACRAIPYGCTRSYGEVAASAGSPGAARAVGQVMAANRAPLIVPCHRVVAAGGKLGGFSAPQGLVLKRRLIGLESGSAAATLHTSPVRYKQRVLA